jgi:hypothetical protein
VTISVSPSEALCSSQTMLGRVLEQLSSFKPLQQNVTNWVTSTQQHFFFTVWKLGSLRSRHQKIWCLVRAISGSHCVLTWWKGQEVSEGIFFKDPNTSHGTPLS